MQLGSERSITLVTALYPHVILLSSFGIYLLISVFSSLSGRSSMQNLFKSLYCLFLILKLNLSSDCQNTDPVAFWVNFNKFLGTEDDVLPRGVCILSPGMFIKHCSTHYFSCQVFSYNVHQRSWKTGRWQG